MARPRRFSSFGVSFGFATGKRCGTVVSGAGRRHRLQLTGTQPAPPPHPEALLATGDNPLVALNSYDYYWACGRDGRGYNNRVDRQASVAVGNDWKKVEELDLAKLTKHLVASTDVPTGDDILWCGFLDPYNEAYDKITARQAPGLKRMENKEFYPVTTTDDPVLEKLAIDGMGQVFITDTILSHLMTCTRSVYPWDIVITKLPGGTLFFDKRDSSSFDYLTVNGKPSPGLS